MIRRLVARVILCTFAWQSTGLGSLAPAMAAAAPDPVAPATVESVVPSTGSAFVDPGVSSLLPVAIDLGVARRFGGFFLQTFAATGSHVHGRLAAGSHVSVNNFSIAEKLSPKFPEASVVVGGDITFPRGRVYEGDIVVAGSAAGIGQSVLDALMPDQTVSEFAELPFDFAEEWARIEQTSQNLSGLTPNGTVQWQNGELFLHGDCQSPSQVFSLNGQQVLDATAFQVDCLPEEATVILNVSGTQAGLRNLGLESLAGHQATTLFNFYQAQTLTLTGVTIRGSVLAPHADVVQPQGVLHGTAIARSWNGPMRIKHVPFRGVGAGDFCPLYPIALPHELVASAAPGTQFLQIPRGTGSGQFSWLTWAGSPNAPTLAKSLTPPGDSYTYVNPYDNTDWLLSPGDWVKGASGNMNSAAVGAKLDALIGQEIAVPAWASNSGQGSNFLYEAQDFVRIRLLAYQLNGKGWLSFEFLGFASCYNRPPTVDAGPDQAIALPPGVASLAGSVDDDGLPSGELEILWTKVSGPGPVTFANPQAAATTATFTAHGEYVLRLTASDTELEASDEMRVVVTEDANEAPVVNAGPDHQITLPVDTLTLPGTATDDGLPQGSSLTILWTQLSGPEPVQLATPTAAVTSARFTAAGTYVLQLSATDGQLSDTDTTTVVVRPANQPPTAQAGPDQTLILPDDEADLTGTVADDGLPTGSLSASWTQVGGPAGVTFANASSAVTTARFPGSGTYVLRLTADDGAASAFDELTVVVEPPIPVISITGASVTEGHHGAAAATLQVHLSVATERIVSVDYGTVEGTAGACDYSPRAGTLTFAAGEVLKTVVVPVTGDLVVEGNETFTARLAQPVQGTIGVEQATATILDDDQVNQPPAEPGQRQPADRSVGVVASPTLSWTASDPDPGDALAYDVYLGTAFDLTGQAWSRTCPAGAAPSARRAPASAYDAGGDRLLVLGGASASSGALGDLWILDDASGAGRQPSWRTRATGAGPSARQSASLVLDPASGRAVLFGGCGDACETAVADAWVLVDAMGGGAPAEWVALPGAPAPRAGHAAAYAPQSGRMIVFGGSASAGGPDSSDVWVLEHATTPASAQWQVLPVGGEVPPARRDAAVAYDAEGDRLFVVGGRTAAGDVLGDAWSLHNASGAAGAPEWVALSVAGTGPAPRTGAVLAYDAPSHRLLLTGGGTAELGEDPAYAFDDLWILTGLDGAAPAWSSVSTSDRPAGRYQAAAGYAPANGRLVVALGGGPQSPGGLDDAWQLADPFGRLPLVSPGQAASTFAAGPLPDDVLHFWRVVARDPKGAFHGSTVFRFTPGTPLIDVASASIPEGHDGTRPMTFALTLSAARDTDIVVSWTTADGSAVAGEDYVSESGTVTFPAGATTATVSVDVIGDHYPESDETLGLLLSDPLGAAIRTGEAVGTIVDDDTPNDPPVVSAGPDQVVPVGSTGLDGTVSDDGRPLPPALSVFWSQVSGPAPATFADAAAVDTMVTLPAAGTYVLRLTASDGELSTSDDVTIEARAGNAPPVVSAGPDQTLLAPANVANLSGFASDDGLPEGSTLTVAWSLVSGPGSASFGNPAAVATTVTVSAPGTYVLRLTASDGVLSAADEATVTLVLANAPPVVSAGPDQSVFLPAVQANLPGTATDDGVPQPLVSTWSVVSGPPGVVFANPSSPVTTATFPGAGVYELRLLATDGEEDVFDEATITVALAPDIVVERVDAAGASVDGQTLAVSGSVDVMLRNSSTTATGPFAVTLFEDRNRDGAYQPGSDELLGVAEHPGLAGSATATLTAQVEGTLLFVGNLVWAFADSAQAVVESDETNNFGSSAPPCQLPLPGPFAPALEWSWTSTAVVPTYTNVMSTPMGADLDLDGVPEVVFASYPGGAYQGFGILRALRGRDGSEMWSATASGSEVNAVGNVAIGNLDADPFPEIVTFRGAQPIAFEHDGTRKWLGTSGQHPNWGGPSLADLDGDGLVEIIAGRQVYNSDGTIRWTGTGTNGDPGNGPLSIVADLDMDGSPEVVAGPTAYRANGTIWWRNTSVNDGATAVGNFDSDTFPEIVVTGGGRVWLLEHDGAIKWGPITHPGGGVPGPPTVADFDGDGAPEIGVAGANRYAVFETNGTVKWSATIQDGSSNRTGSSVFDFEGDGRAEVVYRDETKLWVFRGTDGFVLFSTALHSCTTFEYPIILDVDGDGNAEIVSPANDTCGFGPTTGIHVFGDSADRWVGTRPIWNQHTYHITNIAEDLTIPRHEEPSWLIYNSYRQNILTGACPSAQPDVTASYVRIARQGAQMALTARIGNAGIPVGTVHASFYDGDPRSGGRLLGTGLTSGSLLTGTFRDVTIFVSPAESAYPLWVVADDRGGLIGALTESNETNNFYESPFDLVPTPNEPPVVNAGPDQSAVVGPVALAGQVTDDGLPEGTLVSVWSVVSGPGAVSFADDAQPATTATFTQVGTYVLRLTASDGDLTGQDEVTLTVTAGNQPPSVDAGPDQFATLPSDTVTLQGQVQDDGLPGGPLVVNWTQVSGPAAVVFSSPSTPVTAATASVVGTYVLRLTASDGALAASDDATVRIGDATSRPDLVVASVDASGLQVDDQTFTLSGSAVVTVRNVGLAMAGGPFTLTVFEDRDFDGVLDPTDGMLGSAELADLAPGASPVVGLPLAGTLLFHGNLVHAFVDSGNAVVESDETNNYGNSAPPCPDEPPSSLPFQPVVKWAWTGPGSPVPTANQVESAPVVVDLDLDGLPEVLTNTWPGSSQSYLRALSGRDGSHVFTVQDPLRRLYWASHIAVGNLDADPNPEIVAVATADNRLYAFEHDGTFKWESPILENIGYGGPALADLDGDGTSEIVIGKQALNGDGTLRWTGTGGRTDSYAQLSLVADLDMDGTPEVMAGVTAYRANGSIYWRLTGITDGFNAIGNFDADPFPEVVHVGGGQVRLLEHTGAIKWGPVAIPGGGQGGPPTVADFDGDGLAEIGVAGATRYAVFETNGALRWQSTTQDGSSNRTGSSVFDFEGDGSAEVVYADEVNLRVYRGTDGTILFETRMGSSTAVEYPIVADVDADGHAEIVAVGSAAAPGRTGLYVFGDAHDRWVSTRRIWNQHTYHIDNVRNDATIPAHEAASWSTHNTYRQNLQPGGCLSALPDLVAGHLRVSAGASERLLTARIGNAGNNLAGPVPVAFYDGEPFLGGALLGTTETTLSLAPGQYQDVTLELPLTTVTNRTVWVVADDRGQGVGNVRESNEDNNAYDSRRALTAAEGLPDLAPGRFDLADAADPVTLALAGVAQVEVRNQGDVPASAFDVTAFADRNGNGAFDQGVDLVVGTASAGGVAAGGSTVVDVTLAGTLLFADEPLFVFVDSGAAVLESNESNNVARAGEVCVYQPAPGPFELRVERSWTGSPVNPTSIGVSTTPLVADLDGDARPEILFSTHVTTATSSGPLRAVRGRDMTPVFTTLTNIRPSAQMAVGDIDGDGRPEIVTVSPAANTLVAFEHDGTPKWTSAVIESVGDGGPSIVNLDGTGLPEIVIGRQVLNANGTLRWTGTGGAGTFGGHRFGAAADLNGDGSPEVVAGNTAYRADGTVLWTAVGVTDGFTAVADVDADGLPEVLVANFTGVWCVEHDGTVKWGPIRFGTPIWSAPPTIADIDGDGAPEAIVSFDTHLVALDGLGTAGYVRWALPVNQFREAMAAAYDFDGDGAAEVAFTDGAAFRILSGSDGAVLGQLPLGTFTNRQGIVVADVDADGEAEVLTGASALNGGTTTPGLYVVGESTGAWQPARRIWNESGYHVTNVAEDGTIPAVEPASWLGANVYRAQVGSSAVPLGAPDLSASYPRKVTTPTATQITVRIGNGGSQFAAAGVAVSFYDGDPRENGVLLGTVPTNQDLLAGQYQDVTLSLGPGAYAGRIIWAVADDEGGLVGRHAECDEVNNFLETGFALNEAPQVDAGADKTVVFPDASTTLDGVVTDDGVPADVPLSLRWTRVSGPGLALFASPSSAQTSVTFTSGGVYALRLTASDSVLVSSDDVTVTVTGPNQAPVLSAGVDATLLHPADTHVLAGSASDDGLPLGASVATTWTQVSGPAAAVFGDPSSPSTSVQLPAVGTYVLRLTASDTQLSASDDVEVRRLGPNQAPVVSVGPDQHIALPANTAPLTGSVTDDGQPLGAALVHSWTVVSGPGSVVFSTPAAASTQATFGTIGTYVLRLTVSDTALSGSDEVTVELLPANRAPTVDARPDRVIAAGDDLLIEAAVSDDGLPLPPALTFAWSQVSGPGVAVFSSPASTTTGIQFTQAGVYVLRLSASDGELTGSDDVQITVEAGNLPPVVSAGPDRTLQQPASLLTLNGSVSDDGQPAGSSVSVLWSQVSGPAAVVFTPPTSAVTQAAFSTSGTYVLRLTATDTAATRTDDVTVVVIPVNRAPVVNAGPDQTLSAPPATQMALLGSVSDDGLPAGASVTSVWFQVSGPAAVVIADPSSPVTTASFTALGVYTLRLQASDTLLTAQDDVRVTVVDGNQPPTVDAGPDQTVVAPVDTATLTGSATDDGLPTGAGLRYQWSLASGPALPVFTDPLAPVTTVRLDAPGTYVLRLVVTDTVHTRSDTTSVTLQAAPPVGPPPVVVITAPADGTAVTEPTAVVGTVDSQQLRSWTLERRAAGETTWIPLANGTTNVSAGTFATFDPTLMLNGVQELRLSATDLAGRTSRTSVSVVLKDNQKVGQFSVSFVDLEVPVAGLPIRVTRTYDSRDKARGDFGYGWRLSLSDIKIAEAALLGASWTASTTFGAFPSYCLALSRAAVVTVTMPDGQALEFDPVLNRQCWSFAPPSEVTVSFRARPGTLGTLSILDGNAAFIASSWPAQGQSQPATLLDVNDFDYIDPELYQLTLPDGRSFVVRQGKGLQSLTDLHGNRLTVSPNGIQYQNPGVPGSATGITFVRDPLGRIASITDPLSNVLEYTYDAAGDLVEFEDREDHATTFTYHPSFPHHLLTIVDPLGRTPIRNEYYDDGRIKSHTDAFGKTIQYTHNPSLRQEIVTDRENAVRVMEYDTRGNVVRETNQVGRVIDRTFDARNNRLSETEPYDPAGPPNPIPTTRWTYDAQDNVLSVTDPTGARTENTYNARRQVLTTKDARGVWTENTYDTTGNLTRVRNGVSVPGGPALYETNRTYDAQGNLKTETAIVGGVSQMTRYDYDGRGDLVTETDANGHVTSYTYDDAGHRKTRTTTRTVCNPACSSETLATSYEYDREGRLTKTIDPDGTFTETVYDEYGRRKDVYDKRQKRTTYEYDLMGRRTRTTFADSTSEEATYDGEGRRLTSKDRAGRVTTYEYDDAGRLLKKTFPDDTFIENHFDAAGRVDWTKDARGKTTFFEYDSAGRRTKVRAPLAPGVLAETSFTYDPAGNRASVRDPEGRTTDFTYDGLSRLTRTTFPALAPGEPRLFTETAYDELGRHVSERDAAGRLTRFEYDKLGRLTKVVDAEDEETVYTYDEVGNQISQVDANDHVTRFEYDRLGRQTRRILPGGAVEQIDYDDAGNAESRTDFAGRATTYAYDDLNRLLSRTYPAPFASQNVTFTYWPTGHRKTATDARGTTEYTYDVRDRVRAVTGPDGTVLEYSWDGNGNRTGLTATLPGATPLALPTSFTYDDGNRLDHVTDPAGRVNDQGYDGNGNRTSLAQPNGTLTAYTYDALNRLSTLATTRIADASVVQSYALELGPAGNRTRIVEAEGSVKQYGYDEVYRLTNETVSGLFNYGKTFVYDGVGNRQTQTTTGADAGPPGTVFYQYDERDRLTFAGTQQHDWDQNGNLTTKAGQATYTWDLENRLVRVDLSNGTVVEHAYDVDGNRVRTVTTSSGGSAATTNFLVDSSAALSHVVAETDAVGSLRAYYVRGDDLLAVMRPLVAHPTAAGDWQTRYYHADYIGSVRRLTNEAGVVTDGYTYTAFGELIGHTGSDPQPYAFAGESLDPNSGFQYHRARWMDPRTGRFTAIDRLPGGAFDPGSLHRYLYAQARPSSLVDPSGLYSQAFGYAVEAAIEPYYMADHLGDGVVFGRWNRVADNIRLKPDILNYTRLQWLEIKPLSYSGAASATFKWGIYMAAFSPVGFYPDVEWEPNGDGLISVAGVPTFVFNVAGILFYTDAVALAQDLTALAAVKAVSDVYQLLRSARLAGSVISETARIGRLAGLAATGGQTRVNAAMGPAMIMASIGFP